MHELLLHATVPRSQQHHLLQILAGITAMQPQPLLEHHLVFEPVIPRPHAAKIGPQAALAPYLSADLFYLQLVGDLKSKGPGQRRNHRDGIAVDGLEVGTRDGMERMDGASIKIEEGMDERVDSKGVIDAGGDEKASIDFSANPWTIEYRDLPDVQGRQPATARLMVTVPISDGDPLRIVEGMGYK